MKEPLRIKTTHGVINPVIGKEYRALGVEVYNMNVIVEGVLVSLYEKQIILQTKTGDVHQCLRETLEPVEQDVRCESIGCFTMHATLSKETIEAFNKISEFLKNNPMPDGDLANAIKSFYCKADSIARLDPCLEQCKHCKPNPCNNCQGGGCPVCNGSGVINGSRN